jgi:hypothetical protein
MKNLQSTTPQMEPSISIGSIVYGEANIGCKVLEINGDTLTIETIDGKGLIPFSRVLKVEPPPLLDRLDSFTSLTKSEAIKKLRDITAEFSVNAIYESSLDLHTFAGIFIRRLLAEINPTEFDEIGKDGSKGKYGVSTCPDLPPQIKSDKVGTRVTHIDLYHRYGADIGTIELVDTFGDCYVRWDSDGHIGRYAVDSLKWCEI